MSFIQNNNILIYIVCNCINSPNMTFMAYFKIDISLLIIFIAFYNIRLFAVTLINASN